MQRTVLALQGKLASETNNLEEASFKSFPSPEILTQNYLMLFLEKGELTLRIESRLVDCHAGDAILINCGRHCQLHQYIGSDHLDHHLRILPLNSCWLSSFNQRYNTLANQQGNAHLQHQQAPDSLVFKQVAGRSQILRCMQLLTLNPDKHSITAMLKQQTLAHLLLCDLVDIDPAIFSILSDNEHVELSDRIRTLVLSDLSRTWSGKELAQKLYMSEATLRRKAQVELGSIVHFINNIKMMEALRLLRRTEHSITDVATQLGFCSGAYFSSVFHKEFGMTPTDLRKTPQTLCPDHAMTET